MPAGRKPMGIEQVEQLTGSAAARQRLEVLLANVAGELNVDEACQALGLHKTRFFELRKKWLQGSVESLEPEPAGRPLGASEEVVEPETGVGLKNRPPRIAYKATGAGSPTPDTSGNDPLGPLGRIAELEDRLAQMQFELQTVRLREELVALGLARSSPAQLAQKKTAQSGDRRRRERGGAP